MFPSHLVRPKRSESETLLQTRLHRHKIYFRCQESPRDTSRIAVDLSEKNIDKWKKDGKKNSLWRILHCGRNLSSFGFLALDVPDPSDPLSLSLAPLQSCSSGGLSTFPSHPKEKKKKIPSLPLILPFFDMRNGRKRVSFSRAASSLVPFDMRDRLKTWRDGIQLSGRRSRRVHQRQSAPEMWAVCFHTFSAVMNWHPGPCKLALAVQHNPRFQYQSASVEFITTRCCRSCLKKAVEGLSLQLITSGCEPSGQACAHNLEQRA